MVSFERSALLDSLFFREMSTSPLEMADHLVQEHGLERSLERAIEGTSAANTDGDNYQLSVWREVKVILNDRRDEDPSTPLT